MASHEDEIVRRVWERTEQANVDQAAAIEQAKRSAEQELAEWLNKVRALIPTFLERCQDQLEPCNIVHSRRVGVFSKRYETTVEQSAGWPIAAWHEYVGQGERNVQLWLRIDGHLSLEEPDDELAYLKRYSGDIDTERVGQVRRNIVQLCERAGVVVPR
jgi:hypothetical protein